MPFRIRPVRGEPGTTADERIVPDLEWMRRNYRVDLRDAYATTGHAAGGEHPLGLGVDIVPDFRRGGTWDDVDRLAAAMAKRMDVFRWIGYDGRFGTSAAKNHGRGNHLHLSWNHTTRILGGGQVPTLTGSSGGRRNPARGQELGRFESTSYGPPWNAMNGTGVTANGTDLRGGRRVYGVAVDPSVIALGSRLYITPNPFNHTGTFVAFDTGGAIKGHRIDFYDWRGRRRQNGWGRKPVTVTVAGSGSTGAPPRSRPGGEPAEQSGNPDTVLASWFTTPLVPPFITPGKGPAAAADAAKDAAGAVAGVVDFLKWIAWIFHPRNVLRCVEFVTGFTLLLTGVWVLVQEWRGADSEAPMRLVGNAASLTPAGRALRVAKGRRVGKGLARSQAKRKETAQAIKQGQRKETAKQGDKRLTREAKKDKEPIPF